MDEIIIDTGIQQLINPAQARHYEIIPRNKSNDSISFFIARGRGIDQMAMELEMLMGLQIEFIEVENTVLQKALGRYYRYSSSNASNGNGQENGSFLSDILDEAKSSDSSDIHIEVYEEKARVRYRIDGKLVERFSIDLDKYPSLVNHVKIKSNLDISEKRLPQDGRMEFEVGTEKIDVRISIIPTLNGEKVVMRLLGRSSEGIDINKLGFNLANTLYTYEGQIKRSMHRMIQENLSQEQDTVIQVWRYKYNNNGSLSDISHKVNDQEEIILASYKYNELGQTIEKNLHSEYEGELYLQSVDYRYNIQGWLTKINQSNLSNDNYFIKADINVGADEQVIEMTIDSLRVSITEEIIAPGENILNIDFRDKKKLKLQKINYPDSTRTINANERETVQLYESEPADTAAYNQLKDLDGETFYFILSSATLTEDTETSYFFDKIDSLVTQELVSESISDTNVQDATSHQTNKYIHKRIGVVYFNEDKDDLFGMNLLYNEGMQELGGSKQYNGNISGMTWNVQGSDNIRGYGFNYDDINQLKYAKYGRLSDDGWDTEIDRFSLSSVSYDENGNITQLSRYGLTDTSRQNQTHGLVDSLIYRIIT